MSLLHPFGCLREADAVDANEALQNFVAQVEPGVVQPAEAVGVDDFFDFEREAFPDVGDGEHFFFRADLVRLSAQGADGFAVGRRAPVVLHLVIIGCHSWSI